MNLATALAMIAAAGMPAPNPPPTIFDRHCPGGYSACATYRDRPEGREYIVYVRRTAPKWVWLHELGHIVHIQKLDTEGWRRFSGLAGLTWPWGPGENWFGPEWFAEAYRHCVRPRYLPGPRPRQMAGRAGYMPTVRRHHRLCLFIRRTGGTL